MLKNISFTCIFLFALGTSPALLAADPPDEEPVPATVAPALPNPEIRQQTTRTVTDTRPTNDNHVDFRHCLELKTNAEIIACRYKKK